MRREIDKIIQESHNNNIFIERRELYFYDIADELELSSVMGLMKNINILVDLDSKKPIIINQFSYGGSWDYGMVVYDLLRSLSCPVIYITHGYAGSMGSIVPQGVIDNGLRLTMPNCTWLLHEGENASVGTHRQVKSSALRNDIILSKMYEIYVDCMYESEYCQSESRSKIKNKIKNKLGRCEDWYLSPEEAVGWGLADYVFTPDYEIKDFINGL